ncbi:STE3-domain-containing protein [Eremomyces bilateralis CBS 781.70]|uniref:STE3-domain-containing protein n=1 Tax=Eremomyces bilateralis CBS 781.70 TaxID=1392243 RepID=A0A6G1FRM3_9PEZI|nr:STE3-domain-containing protein [Eremomyces bilateralis CBS 781.70]KAF1808444.1 STE3-domain-containing protein [Eremomyces bilateralis CBS 781.70]
MDHPEFLPRSHQNLTIEPLYPAAVLIAIFSFMAVVLDIAPFYWHLKHRNTGAYCLIMWFIVLNIFNVINAMVWPRDNIADWWSGVGLCDVEIRVITGSGVGIPCSLIIILSALARVLDTDNTVVVPSRKDRIRRIVKELLLCFGVPVLHIVLSYVVQANRFYVFGIAGCYFSHDWSWLAIVLVTSWPIIATLVASYYAVLVIYRIYRYRQGFASVLRAAETSKSRFIRLYLMAGVCILVVLPIYTYLLVFYLTMGVSPYSWERAHEDITRIHMVPSQGTIPVDRYAQLVGGYLTFFIFGLGQDAVQLYSSWYHKSGLDRVVPDMRRLKSITSSLRTRSSFSSMAKSVSRKFSTQGDIHVTCSWSVTETTQPAGSPEHPRAQTGGDKFHWSFDEEMGGNYNVGSMRWTNAFQFFSRFRNRSSGAGGPTPPPKEVPRLDIQRFSQDAACETDLSPMTKEAANAHL